MQSAANLAAATKTPAAITTLFQDQRNRHPAQSELLFLLEAGALQSEAPDQAILALSKGLEALPNSERLLYSRATVYDIVGDFESAEMDFRYLLELKPNDPTALNALGYLMTNNTDRYAEAAALIEAAFQQEPQNPAIIDREVDRAIHSSSHTTCTGSLFWTTWGVEPYIRALFEGITQGDFISCDDGRARR